MESIEETMKWVHLEMYFDYRFPMIKTIKTIFKDTELKIY